MKRTRRITIETERVIEVSLASRRARTPCPECGDWSWMVSEEEAAMAVRTSPREISGLLEAGVLHFTETGGRRLVCLTSLGVWFADYEMSIGSRTTDPLSNSRTLGDGEPALQVPGE